MEYPKKVPSKNVCLRKKGKKGLSTLVQKKYPPLFMRNLACSHTEGVAFLFYFILYTDDLSNTVTKLRSETDNV